MIDVDLNQVAIPLSWSQLFGRDAPTDVEIGSGKGKFLNELAAARPDRNLLAVERSAKYHRLCCDRAARRGLVVEEIPGAYIRREDKTSTVRGLRDSALYFRQLLRFRRALRNR